MENRDRPAARRSVDSWYPGVNGSVIEPTPTIAVEPAQPQQTEPRSDIRI